MATELEKMSFDIIESFRLKHDELKRLQKEIDEAVEVKNKITQNGWIVYPSINTTKEDNLNWETANETIESSQQKIKQIIESL